MTSSQLMLKTASFETGSVGRRISERIKTNEPKSARPFPLALPFNHEGFRFSLLGATAQEPGDAHTDDCDGSRLGDWGQILVDH